jgi:hypothetical protein
MRWLAVFLLPVGSTLEPLHHHAALPAPYLLGLDVFTWLGRLPLAVVLFLLVRAGLRRGWPWRATLLSTAALVAGFALGARALPSIVGAIAGGLATWLVAQRMLGLRRPPLATLALGIAATIAIGRVGCLLAGCCFGVPTELPWAVHYDAGSPAYSLHHALGWLAPGATSSLGVHPTPIYESVGLLAWLALALPLRRRLRSEAAVLLATLAFDLALRVLVDGTRAMINVWWALLGDVAGLDYFRLALGAAAVASALAAFLLERAARRAKTAALSPVSDAVSSWRPWLVLTALVAAVVVGGVGTRPFLALLVILLGASAMSLELPVLPVLARPSPAWSGPALALLLTAPVALRAADALRALPAAAAATPAAGPRQPIRLYEVDPERMLLVRVGTDEQPPADVDEVRTELGLPEGDPAPPPPSPSAPRDDSAHLWLGAGAVGGDSSQYEVDCDGNRTRRITSRGAVGGWIEAEGDVPSGEDALLHVGGRLGFVRENTTATTAGPPSGADVNHDDSVRAAVGQLWVEHEGPYVSLGGGVVGARLVPRSSYVSGAEATWVLAPAAHLRVGAPAAGVDLGFADRTMTELPGFHLGISGHFGDSPGSDRRAGALHYQLALLFEPSPYGLSSLGHQLGAARWEPAVGASLELRASEWVSIGVDVSAYDSKEYQNVLGALYLRLRPF